MIDGMLARYGEALGQTPFVLLTGGSAQQIAPYLRTPAELWTRMSHCVVCSVIWRRNRG